VQYVLEYKIENNDFFKKFKYLLKIYCDEKQKLFGFIYRNVEF